MTPPRPAARRRVSRQRYIVRRIVVGVAAAVVLLAAGFGVVKGIGLLGSDGGENVAEGSGPDSTTATTGSASSSTGAPDGSVATTSTAPAPSAPPTTPAPTAPPVVPPSAENPAKVLVVGDSDAGTFGPYLKELLDGTGVAATTVDYKVSSGLARPDFFDWPAHLAETLPTEQPDITVVTFGGNDGQGLSNADGSNPLEWNDPVSDRDTWIAEYSRRAGAVMDLLAEGGRTVVWVGIPNDDNPEVTARMEVQNEGVKLALSTRPNVQFVDTWTLFSSGNGGWAEYAIDPRDGQGKDVRASDGFHLNENGAEILALDIADVIRDDLEARGADL
jgi:uncharacterized protein